MCANRLWWLIGGCDTRFGQGWIRTSEGVEPADFFVRFDPVGGYFALSGLEIQLAGAYELVEFPLERIFHIRVPGRDFG